MAKISLFQKQSLSVFAVLVLAIALAVPSVILADEAIPDNPVAQQAKKDETDYEFGGQILTLTEPKSDAAPSSNNPRFQDNKTEPLLISKRN